MFRKTICCRKDFDCSGSVRQPLASLLGGDAVTKAPHDLTESGAFSCAMNPFCQIEYVSSDSDVGMPCGKPAVAKCADCGVSICSDCHTECCGDSFCELCYEYHTAHSCLRKTVHNERYIVDSRRAS